MRKGLIILILLLVFAFGWIGLHQDNAGQTEIEQLNQLIDR